MGRGGYGNPRVLTIPLVRLILRYATISATPLEIGDGHSSNPNRRKYFALLVLVEILRCLRALRDSARDDGKAGRSSLEGIG